MKLIVKRLVKGEDLKQSILAVAKKNRIKSGVVISSVGSLYAAALRMPVINKKIIIKKWEGEFEIISVNGTISINGGSCHLHLSFSDKKGDVFGGHLVNGCLVKTTVELTILVSEKVVFKRKIDKETGFEEICYISSK